MHRVEKQTVRLCRNLPTTPPLSHIPSSANSLTKLGGQSIFLKAVSQRVFLLAAISCSRKNTAQMQNFMICKTSSLFVCRCTGQVQWCESMWDDEFSWVLYVSDCSCAAGECLVMAIHDLTSYRVMFSLIIFSQFAASVILYMIFSSAPSKRTAAPFSPSLPCDASFLPYVQAICKPSSWHGNWKRSHE